MLLPFDRARLRERNALDDAEDRADAARRTHAERVELGLSLSQLVHDISCGSGIAPVADALDTLAEKARLYVAPLRLLDARR